MPSSNPSRLTQLIVGALAVGGLASGVTSHLTGITQAEVLQIVNQQVSLSGTGFTAGSTTQYEYSKWMPLKALTATGGQVGPAYTQFSWDYPETYTGAIMEFCIDISTAPTSNATFTDCTVQAASDDTSTGTTLFNNENLTAGAHCASIGSTEVTIGPNQQVRCAGLTGTGHGLVGDAYLRYRETNLN